MGRRCWTRQRFSLRPSHTHSSVQTLSEAGGGGRDPPITLRPQDPAPAGLSQLPGKQQVVSLQQQQHSPLQQGPCCAAVHPLCLWNTLCPPPGSPGGQLVPLPTSPSVTDGWKPSLSPPLPSPAQHIILKASALFQGVKVQRGGVGRDPLLLQPPLSSEGEEPSSQRRDATFSAPTCPRAAVRTGPCSPHPTPLGSAIPDSRRGEGCYGSPNRNLSQLNPPSQSTSLPPLPAAAPGCSSPAKQSHRKQRQFNTGKCLEQGRLGETSLSSSEEESRSTLYFTVSILGGSWLWFSIPGLPLGCHVPPLRH